MKLVFANSAWVNTPEKLILRGGRWARSALRVRYGLVLHPTAGPVMIDTGYTTHSTKAVGRSLGLRTYSYVLRPELIDEQQPVVFLARFNLTPQDITHVVITHFHADHVSGLCLFPNARFVACKRAWNTVNEMSYWDNLRHGIFPEFFPDDFQYRLDPLEEKPTLDTGFGVTAWDIFADGQVLALPLPGHARDHFGLILQLAEKRVLYAADTQWLMAALQKEKRPGYPSRLIADEPGRLDESSDLVQMFKDRNFADVVLCHDPAPTPYDFDTLMGNP